jgi:putative redox protein
VHHGAGVRPFRGIAQRAVASLENTSPMKSIQLAWRPGTARFEATGRGGARVRFEAPGEPPEIRLDDGPHGREAGPSPAELLLVAGAGCASWDLVEILRKQRQDVTTIDVTVDGDQQPDAPWTFRRVELRFTVRGRNLDREQVERAVELSVERYCSVLSTIREAAQVTYATLVEEAPRVGQA